MRAERRAAKVFGWSAVPVAIIRQKPTPREVAMIRLESAAYIRRIEAGWAELGELIDAKNVEWVKAKLASVAEVRATFTPLP
jgi:hypothetical protein